MNFKFLVSIFLATSFCDCCSMGKLNFFFVRDLVETLGFDFCDRACYKENYMQNLRARCKEEVCHFLIAMDAQDKHAFFCIDRIKDQNEYMILWFVIQAYRDWCEDELRVQSSKAYPGFFLVFTSVTSYIEIIEWTFSSATSNLFYDFFSVDQFPCGMQRASNFLCCKLK